MKTEPRYELNIDLGVFKKGMPFVTPIGMYHIEINDGCSTEFVIQNNLIDKFLADGIIKKVEEPKNKELIHSMQDMCSFAYDIINEYMLHQICTHKREVKTIEQMYHEWLSKQEEGKV